MEEFQIHSAYDHHALKTMSRVLRKTVRRKWSIALRVFGWTVVSVYVLLNVLLLCWGDFDPDIVALLAIVFVLSALLFEDDVTGWAAGMNLLPGTREADTRFLSDEYIVTTQATETRMHYENIGIIGETKDSFVFIIGKRHAQQFPKAGLAAGTPEQFRDFIAQKTGLSVRYVK
ncbi:MAG: YcxB family protein [Oscillospiraceae bacterium]|nr:YcxB family protein [Oscillospiraceae bacterium]